MTDARKLQGIRLRHLLLWAALLCWPVARAFGTQPQEFTFDATATTTQEVWVSTGSLNFPRRGHTATLLSGGKVLVAGGLPGSGGGITAELYDPTTGIWTRTGDEACAKGWEPDLHRTATLLSNGKVLVAGGGFCAQLFDPATGLWTPTGSMNGWRYGHTANRLADGRVLVASGMGYAENRTASAEIYDPVTGVWTLTGWLGIGRYGHTSTLLRDGRVLVAGGYYIACGLWCEDYTPFSSTEIFDPRTGTWTTAGELTAARYGHSATLLPSGKVLVAGGYGFGFLPASEVFDPATGTWSATGDLNFPRRFAVATPLPTGDVLVTGGDGPGPVSQVLADAEIYDTASGKWVSAGRQIAPRLEHTATLLQDGRVLLAGGYTNSAEISLPPPGSIGPWLTGSWYDPAQSGHGLHLEVLADNKLLAAWFAFDPSGHQAWFMGVGTYSGNTATVTSVVQPVGGRWIPNFDPAKVVNRDWGTLTFTVTDCNRARVAFDSKLPGYDRGSMNLTRLTLPGGLACPGDSGEGYWDY